jgi:hypothetical protein
LAANNANANAITSGAYANSAFTQANSAFSSSNGINLTQNTSITAAFTQANSAYGSQNTTGIYANAAFIQANAAYAVANVAATPLVLINSTYITSNVTIAANTNGLSVGPLAIANSYYVNVASGQRWIIL